jgi:hypothetical protein
MPDDPQPEATITDGSSSIVQGADAASAEPDGAFDPQRLLRIAGVTREVLEEARRIQHDEGAVRHLRDLLDHICDELQQALPPELYRELDELTPQIHEGTLEELTLAHAEILGWLQGLFQGTQLAIQLQAIQAQQAAARRALPGRGPESPDRRPDGTYL